MKSEPVSAATPGTVTVAFDPATGAMFDPFAASPPEQWPGQHEHWRQYDQMMAESEKGGPYIDPVSGKPFPKGQCMLRDPNRTQRRVLEKWRKAR